MQFPAPVEQVLVVEDTILDDACTAAACLLWMLLVTLIKATQFDWQVLSLLQLRCLHSGMLARQDFDAISSTHLGNPA
ncbi:hypothetical protein AAC387_Pa05g2933 [Persea americana]